MRVTDIPGQTVIIASAQPGAYGLQAQFESAGWTVRNVGFCYEVEEMLPADLLCIQDRLPDGDWRVLLESIHRFVPNVPVVVFSPRCTLPLMLDVLSLGALDLLPAPCPDDLFEGIEARVAKMIASASEAIVM